jgi:CheY-like chemotaxis protein
VVAATLKDEGYVVQTARDGAGLALLEQPTTPLPDTILLDMRVPVLDGWEFVRRYRQAHDHHAKIVVMTAAVDAEQLCQEVRADGCLPKPFALADVLTTVARVRGGAFEDG